MNSMDKQKGKPQSGRAAAAAAQDAGPSTPKRTSRRLSDVPPPAPIKSQRAHGVSGDACTNAMEASEEERMLHKFDLTLKFGPCTSMTRMERWERAEKFGLSPPEEIREILLACGPNDPRRKCIWAGRV